MRPTKPELNFIPPSENDRDNHAGRSFSSGRPSADQDPVDRGSSLVGRKPEGWMVAGNQAGGFHSRHHRGSYRCGHYRLWQFLRGWSAHPSRFAGARTALCGRERAGAGARRRETSSEHLLDGSRRHADPHHQRHRYCPVGHPGQGNRHAGRPASRRYLSSPGSALLLAAHGRAGPHA